MTDESELLKLRNKLPRLSAPIFSWQLLQPRHDLHCLAHREPRVAQLFCVLAELEVARPVHIEDGGKRHKGVAHRLLGQTGAHPPAQVPRGPVLAEERVLRLVGVQVDQHHPRLILLGLAVEPGDLEQAGGVGEVAPVGAAHLLAKLAQPGVQRRVVRLVRLAAGWAPLEVRVRVLGPRLLDQQHRRAQVGPVGHGQRAHHQEELPVALAERRRRPRGRDGR